jgi:branched-chain amino acid transport system ATP-binding protein
VTAAEHAAPSAPPLLEAADLEVFYGPLRALHGVSLAVHEGETVALIGANGAGKSTLLQALVGGMAPHAGTIRWEGEDITATPDFQRVRLGLSLTPEGARLFPSLTVEENLLVGGQVKRPGDWSLERAYETFPLVADVRNRRANLLSGGERQAVAIARSLMSNPRLLMLDEVSLGLAPVMIDVLYESLERILAQGISVILVEQDLDRSMAVSDRLYCMLEGRVVLSGRSREIARDDVVAAYFGTREDLQKKATSG